MPSARLGIRSAPRFPSGAVVAGKPEETAKVAVAWAAICRNARRANGSWCVFMGIFGTLA
ncbi:hypothetical protein SBV1_1500016 [Verrucomicrobia bacterium]|nr:hypothetical protein SBV1_1500016 [Verrucomicrobiota bacterium]